MLGVGAEGIVSILQIGFSGVAFLFLYMSFSMLSKEQARDAEPREKMLAAIKSFLRMTLIFTILVLASGVADFTLKGKTLPERCSGAIERASLLSENLDVHDFDSIHDLLKNTVIQCTD